MLKSRHSNKFSHSTQRSLTKFQFKSTQFSTKRHLGSPNLRTTNSQSRSGSNHKTSIKFSTKSSSKSHSSTPTSSSPSPTIYTKPSRNSQFSTLDEESITYFTTLLGSNNMLTSVNDDLDAYNTDWTRKYSGNSKLVLFPCSTEHVSAILKHCSTKRLAVVPQSGNSGLVGGSIPVHDEIVINMSKMNKIIHLNKEQGIVIAESGVILQNLTTFLEENGFTTPLDLGAKASCMIGGNVSTNAGGLRVLKYGSLRGSVLGLEVVTAENGNVLDLLSSMRKDNTGYDLKQLFIGGEGTLGIITKVSILCPPKPRTSDVCYLRLDNFAQAVGVMTLARSQLHDILSAVEFQDSVSVDIIQKYRNQLNLTLPFPFSHNNFQTNIPRPMYMLLECSGSDPEIIRERIMSFFDVLSQTYPSADAVIGPDDLWKLREYVPISCGLAGTVFKYDISLPVPIMYDTVERTKKRIHTALNAGNIADKHQNHIYTVGYGHLGDGNLHLNVVIGNELKILDEFDTIVKIVKDSLEPFVFDVVSQHNGSISAEHGLGIQKNDINANYKPALNLHYMQQIKQIFDPQGILNPYKFLPTTNTHND